jgi:hypothetical protein
MTDAKQQTSHNDPMKTLHLEVPYEGDHCIPCVYMVEVVEEAVKRFGVRVRWERVWLKKSRGAKRYLELSNKLGVAAPIPSIIIDEKLVFDMIPPVEDLQEYIEDMLKDASNT